MKEFYTIDEVCSLFGVSKENLKQKCTQYDVQPHRNEIGEAGFVKYDVRKLHNKLYYENRSESKERDVWDD